MKVSFIKKSPADGRFFIGELDHDLWRAIVDRCVAHKRVEKDTQGVYHTFLYEYQISVVYP